MGDNIKQEKKKKKKTKHQCKQTLGTLYWDSFTVQRIPKGPQSFHFRWGH